MGQGKRVGKEEAGACRERGWQVISERGKHFFQVTLFDFVVTRQSA